MLKLLLWCKINFLFKWWSFVFSVTDFFYGTCNNSKKEIFPGLCVKTVANHYYQQLEPTTNTKDLIVYCYIYQAPLFLGVRNKQLHVSQYNFNGSYKLQQAPLREIVYLTHLFGEAQAFILKFNDEIECNLSDGKWSQKKKIQKKATRKITSSSQILDALENCPFRIQQGENCWIKDINCNSFRNLDDLVNKLEGVWHLPLRCSLFGMINIKNDQDNVVLFSDSFTSSLIVKQREFVSNIGLHRFAAIKTNNFEERFFILAKVLQKKQEHTVLLITSNNYAMQESNNLIIVDKLKIEKRWGQIESRKFQVVIIDDAASMNMRSKYAFLLSTVKPDFLLLFYDQRSIANILPLSGLSPIKSDFPDLNILSCLQEKNVLTAKIDHSDKVEEEKKNIQDHKCVSIKVYKVNQARINIDTDTAIRILKLTEVRFFLNFCYAMWT